MCVLQFNIMYVIGSQVINIVIHTHAKQIPCQSNTHILFGINQPEGVFLKG